MNLHLRVLIIEDSEDDMLLMLRALRQDNYQLDYLRVDTPLAMQVALAKQRWDIVIADYTLPSFSAPAALKLLKEQQPDVPFIIVSGTIGEEIAVAAMKAGANDYLIKGNLARLLPAVERELRESEERQKQRKTERALRESEERYRLLFESNPNPMWVFDLKTFAFLAVNRAAIAHYGYSQAEFLSMTITDILSPTPIPTLKPPQSQIEVWKHRRKDGQLIDVEVRTHTLSFGGELASLVLVNDITDRLQAEQKIREQAALLDVATDAIFVRDLEHHILFWNKGAESLYGWESPEAVGKKAIELLYRPEATLPPVETIQTILTAEGHWQGELQQITKDGKNVIVESRWTMVNNEEGDPLYVLTVNTDITEKKQLAEQFLRAQRLESLGTLASGIAHDFNNILTPILAIAQTMPLQAAHQDAQSLHLLKIIEDSAKRGAGLVQQILAFAQGSEGQQIPLQVRHLLAEVIKVVRQTFQKTISIETDIPSTDLWTVAADATQLHQVLVNLCVNARDAMPDGGTLSLAAENQIFDAAATRIDLAAHVGPYVVITISDTGMGIPPELLDRIFDPFFTTKELGKGTGLGLSTVLGIVKNHGGFVRVVSEVGQGTTFQVYLPAIADTVSFPPNDLTISVGEQELILIVDDEPLIQQVAQAALEVHNYRTLLASDGLEAIALYAEHQHEIGAVLMDSMMPVMDGLTTTRNLQKMNPQVKVIAMSGLAANSLFTEGPNIGIAAFLAKPYTVQELLDTIQQVLQGST